MGKDRNKLKTKVFAGGAVIAEQVRTPGANNTNIDTAVWIHADPVSGSSTIVNKDGTEWYRTEYEPLGSQEVHTAGDQEDFPDPPPGYESAGKADDSQWQCQIESDIGTTFQDLPSHCQRAIIQNDPVGDWRNISWRNPRSNGGAAPPPGTGQSAGPEDVGSDGSGSAGGHMPVNPSPTSKPSEERRVLYLPASSVPNVYSGSELERYSERNSSGQPGAPENNAFVGADFQEGDNLPFKVNDSCLFQTIDLVFSRYKTLSKTFSEQMMNATGALLGGATGVGLTVAQTAYLLATGEHESKGFTDFYEDSNGDEYAYFEGKYGYQTTMGKALGNVAEGDGHKYRGMGIIQVTGLNNYKWVNIFAKVNVIDNPNVLATDIILSAVTAVLGIKNGQFGDPISKHINEQGNNFVNARNSVNSNDNTYRNSIAARATTFLSVLRGCQ